MSDKPLGWLDCLEEDQRKHLLRDFRTKVHLFESFIEVVEGYVSYILDELPTVENIDDLINGDDVRLRRIVAGLILYESCARLSAVRRMLLCGYQASMLAGLRDMWEAVYYSDVCLQNGDMAREWLNGAYLPKPGKLPDDVKVRDRIEKYRKGKNWDLLSKFVHPTVMSRTRTILFYKTPKRLSLIKEVIPKGELQKQEKEQTFNNIWLAIFAANNFLEYLRDVYPSVYKDNGLIRSEVDRLDKRFQQHIVILGRQLRDK
jgi:hypothetical protein